MEVNQAEENGCEAFDYHQESRTDKKSKETNVQKTDGIVYNPDHSKQKDCSAFYIHTTSTTTLSATGENDDVDAGKIVVKNSTAIVQHDDRKNNKENQEIIVQKASEIVYDPESHLDAEKDNPNLPDESEINLSPRRWLILAIFSMISMTNAAMWISLSSISSIVKGYYKVSYASANWLSMIFSFTYFFVVLSVFTLNKYGLKATICIGAVMNAMGAGLKLIGSGRGHFRFAIVGNGFAGIAQCFILFVPPTLAATWFGEKERGLASAIGMLMNMLGVSLGYIMGGTIVPNSSDYDGVVKKGMFKLMLSQAVVSIILAVLSFILIQSTPLTPPSMSQLLLQEQKWEKKMDKRLVNDVELRFYYVESEGAGGPSLVFAYREGNEFNTDRFVVGFRKSFKLLWKNKDFHLITQAYGIFFGLYLAINTLLNHICTLNFPGKEAQISLMGSVSVIVGLVGMLISGFWIDRKHEFRCISFADFVFCAIFYILFIIFSAKIKSFQLAFVCFSIYGFFSYPYMTIGLEHAAEIAFPVSEAVTSAILLLVANTYGIVLTFLVEMTLEYGGTLALGCLSASLYLIGAVITIFIKGKLRRLDADRNSKRDSVRREMRHVNCN